MVGRKSTADTSIGPLFFRLCLSLAVPLMLLWGIVPAPTTVFLWDWANAIGYLAVALLFLLFVYRGQPQSLPAFSGRFFINLHRDLGVLALIFVGLHMGVLLASEPLLMEHLKPTAPWYMLSGLASAVLLIMIVLSSLPSLRKRVWSDYSVFRKYHLLISVSIIVLLLIHLFGSQYYLNSLWKKLLMILMGCYVLTRYSIQKRRSGYNGSNDNLRKRGNVSVSMLVSYGSLWVMLLLSFLLVLLQQILMSDG